MSWKLDGKIRIHARLSDTSYMRLHSWTSVSLRRLYIGQFLSLHFKHRDEDFLSKGLKDILHDKKIFSCTAELPNESASLVVILFCFVVIWDESVTSCFHQKLYEVFNILQAFFFKFYLTFWESTRDEKKTHFALFGSRSKHMFPCYLAGPTTTYK